MTTVRGDSSSANDPAVQGMNTADGDGVNGESTNGTGVHGRSSAPDGSKGQAGVVGEFDNGVGVFGRSSASSGVGGMSKSGFGVHGVSESSNGVRGDSTSAQGVYGHSVAQAGVVGESDQFDGVYGIAHLPDKAAVTGYHPGGTAGYFNGNVYVTGSLTTDGDVVLTNADCAEHFDAVDPQSLEPGTVVVLDDEGRLSASHHAYDKRVAGVVSGAGGYRPAIVLDKQPDSSRLPVALIGKAYCKVDASHAAIEVGDLLTASPTPGHAMKAADPLRAFGAVIGKALRAHAEGPGLIPMLIALQ